MIVPWGSRGYHNDARYDLQRTLSPIRLASHSSIGRPRPQDHSETRAAEAPAFERDTTNIYLVTSRDGVHIDDGWVYAHRPLLPKGRTQGEWDAGFVLPAAQFVTTAREHLLYFEVTYVTYVTYYLM